MEQYGPTLLIDETDSFLRDNEELRGILNSGHRRAMAYILRTVGDEHEPRGFSTWAPKVIALIKRLPATLEDRSIIVNMSRKRTSELVERLKPSQLHDQLEDVRRKCLRWSQDNEDTLRRAEPQAPEGLHDRANDNWEPLIAIAELCGYSGDLRNAALELSGTPDDTAPGVQLLAAVREIFQANDDKIGSGELAEELCKREEEPWAEWRRGKPITATGIAGLLKPFGIRPRNVWVGKSCLKGYRLEDFEDAFSRYIPSSEPLEALGSSSDAGFKHFDEPLGEGVPSGSEIDLKASPDAGSSGPSASYTSTEEDQESTTNDINHDELLERFMRIVQDQGTTTNDIKETLRQWAEESS